MTNEEIDRLSIAEVRAISERAADALSRFREVQAMLGGAIMVPTGSRVDPGQPGEPQYAPNGVIQTNKGAYALTPAERAAKAALPAFGVDGEPLP